MADESRALRNAGEDITAAFFKLKCARRDGDCESIRKAAALVNEKLEHYGELIANQPKQPQGTDA